ncbi:MAG: hypothetical protein ACYS8Z_24110 [Planctomycetota bacterium]|jgi:hypothetical protein
MKSPVDKDLDKAYEAFNQNHDNLRRALMASLPDRPEESARAGRANRATALIGDTIMRNRITKLAAAAVIIIAVLIGINHRRDSINGASVAWGQVLETMNQVPTVVYKMTRVISFPGGNRKMSTKSDVYDCGAQGNRIDMYMNGELAMQKFMLPQQGVAYFIRPRERQYTRFELSDEQAMMKEDFPRQWVKIILSEDYGELGPANINGIKVEGVEVHNSKLLGDDEGVVRLWVDVETNLPVRVELEGMMMESGAKRLTKHVIDDFQWDVEIDAGIFEPNIPEDYSLREPQAMPEAKESEERKSLSTDEKSEQASVEETARALFQACADENWDEFSNIWPGLSLNEMQKSFLGGLESIYIGDAFKTDDSATWYVPYQIKLKLGGVKERNLRVRYDETTNRFIACGGL